VEGSAVLPESRESNLLTGAGPSIFEVCSLGPERTRIFYVALLAITTCPALRREPYALPQRHDSQQEIRGTKWRDLLFSALFCILQCSS
jgi:hypothetical protein